MKKLMKTGLLITMAAVLTACGNGGSSGPVYEGPYEPVAYSLYPAPDDAYVGDTMPFVTEDGKLELYYLYDTDHNGQAYHPIYRYTTSDFVSYEDDGMMINFGTMADPDPAIGTGSVMKDRDGLYHCFYTGHNDINGNAGKDRECVMHAVSTDRQNWTKIPEDTFYSAENYSGEDFRDPEVFWNEEDQCYWLLIAARENTKGGVVAKYTSTDLKNWELCDPLYAPMQQYMLECPDLFKMGDKYYLTYSWDCVTYYAMSDSMNGPFTAPADNVLDGNNFIFYAAKTEELNGNRYLCGWLGRSALNADTGLYGWAGNILNHQLVQKEDGTLGVKAPDTFADYFTEQLSFKAEKKEGNVKAKKDVVTLKAADGTLALADMGMRAPTMILECDVTMGDSGCAGFVFGGPDKKPNYSALCLDADRNLLHYEGTDVQKLAKFDPVAFTKFDFSKNSTHHIKLVFENEIAVLYVDDTKALSNRIFNSADGANIGVFAQGTDAEFSNITLRVPGEK